MIEPFLSVAGLILSAFFSGAEIAFVRANPLQIKVWERQKLKKADRTFRYLEEPERFLTTVLVGTNLANVLTSSYATIALIRFGFSEVSTIVTVAMVILIFGEVIPKIFFGERANLVALRITPLLNMTEILLTPFVRIVKSYSRLISPSDSDSGSLFFSRDDLRVLFEKVETSEEYEEEEKEVISKIFDFGSRPVRMAMTTRPDMVAITLNYHLGEAIQVMSDTGLSKLPVYEGDLDNIVGVVFLHDLFTHPDSLAWIAKPPLYVSESTPANRALQKLKKHKSSIAIVTGPDGETVGLVTVEDLVEEIFGEFEDVFDEEGRKITRVPDGSLVVDSLVEVEELKKRFKFQIPEGDYQTIGGFILSRLGRIPRAGEMLNFETFRIKILRATPSRVKQLHLIRKA